MAWIRVDCSLMDDEFVVSLSGDEFRAWIYFLLRTKSFGARGSVPRSSISVLSRTWQVPEQEISSMFEKAGDRIFEKNGRWYVKNWRKYQDDFRSKGASPENSGYDAEPPTVQHDTLAGTEPPRTVPEPTTIFPILSDVIQYFVENKFINPKYEAEKFYKFYSVLNWSIKGVPIRSWSAFAIKWNQKSIVNPKSEGEKHNGERGTKYSNLD